MLSRKTRALFELAGAAVWLIVSVVLRREAKRYRHIDQAARIEAVTERCTDDSSAKMAAEPPAGATTDDMKALFGAGLAEAGMAAPLKPRWILIGIMESLTWGLLYDYDVGRIRQSHRRRIVVGVLRYPVQQMSTRRDATWSHGIGYCVGTIIYRLKYGVLDDPPEA